MKNINKPKTIAIWKNSLVSLLFSFIILTLPFGAFAQKPAISLEQVRNGGATSPVSPGNWQNGNLNSSQAHFVEGHSIPYRALLTNLPVGTPVTLTLAFDITHSSKNA